MWQWLAENHLSLTVFANIGMLTIWLLYLGVFLRQYRRQTRPRILISRAAGNTLDASCFITNMSSDPVYLEAISVTLEGEDSTWTGTATDVRTPDGEQVPEDPRMRTHQGPIQPAGYFPIGTFRTLLERVGEVNPKLGASIMDNCDGSMLCIKVYADYASEDLIIGAERRFRLAGKGHECRVLAEGRTTRQIRSRARRRRAEAELQQLE